MTYILSTTILVHCSLKLRWHETTRSPIIIDFDVLFDLDLIFTFQPFLHFITNLTFLSPSLSFLFDFHFFIPFRLVFISDGLSFCPLVCLSVCISVSKSICQMKKANIETTASDIQITMKEMTVETETKNQKIISEVMTKK